MSKITAENIKDIIDLYDNPKLEADIDSDFLIYAVLKYLDLPCLKDNFCPVCGNKMSKELSALIKKLQIKQPVIKRTKHVIFTT